MKRLKDPFPLEFQPEGDHRLGRFRCSRGENSFVFQSMTMQWIILSKHPKEDRLDSNESRNLVDLHLLILFVSIIIS